LFLKKLNSKIDAFEHRIIKNIKKSQSMPFPTTFTKVLIMQLMLIEIDMIGVFLSRIFDSSCYQFVLSQRPLLDRLSLFRVVLVCVLTVAGWIEIV
jgi:hypothetical protein